MKPINNNAKTPEKIKLTQTFFSIEKGEVSAAVAAARKKKEKEAARAEVVRKGGIPDRTDPFLGNLSR
ncbi:MAG: hypothetical protein JWM68_1866 [Verrucomicrobiales bacterium]|nr:hypothetical protein [Verrucomicrobiales bacterium]